MHELTKVILRPDENLLSGSCGAAMHFSAVCVAGDMAFCCRAASLAPAGGEQQLADSGVALIRNIKDSVPYDVPQIPRAVTKMCIHSRF